MPSGFSRRTLLDDGFTVTKSDPALAQPGRDLPVAVTSHLQVDGARLCWERWRDKDPCRAFDLMPAAKLFDQQYVDGRDGSQLRLHSRGLPRGG